MRKSFQRVILPLNLFQGKQSLTIFLLVASCLGLFVACDDSSSANGEETGFSANEIASSSSSSRNDISSSSVIASEAKQSSSSPSVTPSEETGASSSEFASTSSSSWQALSSTIRNDSSSSSVIASEAKQSSSSSSVIASEAKQSSSSSSVTPSEAMQSSSSIVMATPCKTETEDNCEYGTLLDERDGQEYKTVKIGEQTWMAENLNYADSVTTTSLKGNSWCYNNVTDNCDVSGRLYTWEAAIDSVCPKGWHLPSKAEFETLRSAVGNKSIAGGKLKSTSGWYSANGTDTFGFSALPTGARFKSATFFGEGYSTYFWSSTEFYDYYAYSMELNDNGDQAYLYSNYKEDAFSVRCIKDSE